jgi:hypothetical protein
MGRFEGRMGELISAYKFWLEIQKGRDHLEDPGVDWKIMLKLILGKYGSECGLDSSCSR